MDKLSEDGLELNDKNSDCKLIKQQWLFKFLIYIKKFMLNYTKILVIFGLVHHAIRGVAGVAHHAIGAVGGVAHHLLGDEDKEDCNLKLT